MADEKITLSKQRNLNDVAVELTLAYMDKYGASSVEEVMEMYKKFHKNAFEAKKGNY